MIRLLLALLLLLPASAECRTARPALWAVSDRDTTIYLLGTIHVLPKDYRWRDRMIDRAVARAQSLTLEVVLDRMPRSPQSVLQKLGVRPGLPPLLDRVPPERRDALKALMARGHLPVGALDGFATWAAAVVLTGLSLDDIPQLAGNRSGVEEQVTATFRAAHKPIDGLETAEQQLGTFATLPEAQQRVFLASTLDPPAKSRADYAEMLSAWSAGDVPGILRSFAKDPEFTPELRDVLIRRRNRSWAGLLAARMARPGTLLVAVGAGHLAGPDSLQAMLAAAGFKVRRLQ